MFPLLTKIIDAKSDLSIQVHPDDSYAMAHEKGSLGKTECWYVLDCDPGATIIIGHNAKTHEELKDMIESRGGRVAGSVSSNTTCLINNDVTSSSSKNRKAKELGVAIVSEDDFMREYLK